MPQWDPTASAAENARRKLPGMVERYLEAGTELLANRTSPKKLHAFRLHTKRLRYTLELFTPCYGRGLQQRLAVLHKVQDFLGDIQDCTVAERLGGRAARGYLRARAARQLAALRRYWRSSLAGREQGWRRYLERS